MKLSPYLKLNRIEFAVTYHCTGKCIHCSVAEQLNTNPEYSHVLPEKAVEAIRWLCKYFKITSLMTFGGEPLLYPEVVAAIHATAKECGIEARQLITNGYFSKEPERIREVAAMLNDAGVNNILLSVDAFHQETIPLEQVRIFAQGLKDAGVPKVRWQPAWVVNKEHENPYNMRTKEILTSLEDIGLAVAGGNDIFLAGNAAKYLAEYYEAPKLDLTQVCGTMPYTDALTEIQSLSIVPNGDVMICSYVIGNIYSESIADIVARYNPHDNVYMNALLTGGGEALLKVAKSSGIDIKCEECYSVCDICRKVNKQK